MRTLLAALGGAVLLAFVSCTAASPVLAAPKASSAAPRPDGRECQPYGVLVRMVEEVFGQRAAFAAITRDGVLIEFYVSADQRWSGVVTTGDGCSDLFDQGVGWEAYPPPAPTPKHPPPSKKKGG